MQEGWSLSVIKGGKTHYFRNGVSLCGKSKVNRGNKRFDKDRMGNVFFHDCATCVKYEYMELTQQKEVQ